MLAVCYALLGRSKSLQNIYRDAYLAVMLIVVFALDGSASPSR